MHRPFFEANQRTKMMLRTLDRLDAERRQRIFQLADRFIDRVTK